MSATTHTLTYDDVLARLWGVHESILGQQATARCPAHDDRKASLSVGRGENGTLLLDCHAGCRFEDILAALRLEGSEQEDQANGHHAQREPLGPIVAIYYYRAADGTVLYRVTRHDPKAFRPWRPDGQGGWLMELGNSPRVPYLLPELNAADPELPVLLVEGEKDADRAHQEGFMATTITGGAKNWRKSADVMAKALKGRRVVITPDADDAGDGYARDALATLQSVAKAVAVLQLPRLPHTKDHGEDLSDWLDTHGGTVEELEQLIDTALACDEGAPPPSTEQAEPFPVDALPEPLHSWVIETAAAIQCPPDFLAVPALVLAGAAIGNSRTLELKPGYMESARLWAAIVARAGDKKSPALAAAGQALHRKQREYALAYAREKRERDSQSNEPPPVMQQVMTTDATMEALADILDTNRRGVTYFCDELTAWALSMNQYKSGKGGDRGYWLSFWSGAPVVINRRSRREPIHLDDPFVSVVGALPPDMLNDLSDERGREDGFIHRILFAWPDPMPDRWTERFVQDATKERYLGLFKQLWELKGDPVDEMRMSRVVRFTPEGKAAWVQWHDEHSAEREAPSFPDNLRGPWSKLTSACARLALIVHTIRHAMRDAEDEHVDELSMAMAACMVDQYFKPHTRRVYGHLTASPEGKRALAVVAWMRKQKMRQVSARDVMNAAQGGVRTKKDAEALFNDLVEMGFGTVSESKTPRGTRLMFTLSDQSEGTRG